MTNRLRHLWVLRVLALVLVWGLLSGFHRSPIWAEGEAMAAQPAPTKATPSPAAPTQAAGATGQDAVWAAWETLSPDVKAKVDGRILSELQGESLPAHLGGQILSITQPGGSSLPPLQHTRFIVHLQASADLSVVDQRVYASQADRRSALVSALRTTAASSQAGVLGILNARSGDRAGGSASVASFQPFYVINAVAAEADLSTIIELAQRPDVTRIVANYPLYPVLREAAPPVAAPEIEAGGTIGPAQTDAGGTYYWNLQKVGADRVHTELGIRGAGAVVGGFDTGVNYRHPALLRQYRGNQNGVIDHNYNWFVPDGELYPNGNLGRSVSDEPTDCAYSTHGTHTMGTMVGEGSTTTAPTIGMAPDARWIAVPGICGDTMPGGIQDDIGGIKAFQWFLCPTDLTGDLASADCSKAPDVVNSSWGSANPVDDTFRPILQVLRAAGVAPVFAAGNPSAGAGSIGTPANIPEAIAVGATNEYDGLAYFSAQGPSFYPGEQKPELSAPGDYVLSSVDTSTYDNYSGTSMAAPHVAGLIALLVSADLQDGFRDFDVAELERLMELSAVDLGAPGPDTLFGYGRIDAYAAVQLGLTAGDLRGQFFDAERGTPIPAVWIEAVQAGSTRPFTAQADASGSYSLTLPAGDYQVSLSAWGYETTPVGTHKLVAGALALHNFSLLSKPKATLSGTVRDESGPVADALIYPAGNPAYQVRSGGDGRYQILLPLGAEELVVTASKHRLLRQPVTTPDVGGQVDFMLKSAPSILLVDTSPLGGWFLGWPVYRFFTRALDEQRYQYDLWRIQYSNFSDTRVGPDGSTLYGLPSAATLKGYDLVIWAQSSCADANCYASSTADIGADPALTEFLDSGGRLFISGQDMGWSDGQSVLFDEYLQADLYYSDGGYTGDSLTGVDILSGFQMTLTNGSLYGYANSYLYSSPDAVVPQPDGVAFPVLEYSYLEAAAALAVAPCDASYRAFYLAAGYENLAPRGKWEQPEWSRLLDVSITWLTGDGADSRYSFAAGDQFKNGAAGDDVYYTFSVANLGDEPMDFTVDLAGNRWPTSLQLRGAPLVSPVALPACTRSTFDLRVSVPHAAQLGEQDVVTVTVGAIGHPSLPIYEQGFETLQMAQWTAAEPLPTELEGMSTFALDTSYDLIGGWVPFHYDEAGTPVYGTTVAEHWRFDPCTAAWESRAPLPEPRQSAASAAIGERFFVAGGVKDTEDVFVITDSLFIYDNTTDTWTTGAPMPRPLAQASGAAVDGKFYVFGGYDSTESSANFYVYDPATDQWQDMGTMPTGTSSGFPIAAANGAIYLQGSDADWESFYRYEPATDRWEQMASPRVGSLGRALVAAPDGYLYLLGSTFFYDMGSLVERYDVATDVWSSVNSSLDFGRFFSGAAYVGGKLYLVGGSYATLSHESLRLYGDFCESALINPQTAAATNGEIVYTLDIRPGDQAYPAAQLTAPLHPSQTFAKFVENAIGATYNPATHAVEWNGSLPADGAPLRLSYAARLNDGVWQVGEHITHTISLDSGGNRSLTRSTTTQLFAPDFSASSKAVSQPASATGTPFTYTIALDSRTPAGGEVTVVDPLPSALAYVAGTLDFSAGAGSYNPDTHSIQWQGPAGVARPGYVNLGTDYAWVDTLGAGQTAPTEFVWQDIRSTGTSVVSGVYAISCDIALGFPFPYFGDEYTTACVDVSGIITFGDSNYPDVYNGCPLSGSFYDLPGIAGLWGQFAVNDGVYVQTFGTAPHRYTIFQWTDARPWDYYDDFFGLQRPPDTDFQIVLHENGRVQVHILRLGVAAQQSSSTGLIAPVAGKSLTYQCNGGNSKLRDQMTVEFLPPGGTLPSQGETIHFQVMAKADTPINSLIPNTVSIQSGQDVYTRTASLLIRSVDLSGSVKTASRTDLLPGESVAYTITLHNQGLAASQQITLSDALPGALSIAPGSLLCSRGTCNESGGLVTWQGDLSANGSVSLTYSATLNSILPDKTALTNTVQIRSTGIADLARSAVVYARSSNLSASVFDFGGKPNEPGDRFTLSAFLRNTGIQSSVADFSMSLPDELSYIPGTLRCGIGTCRIEEARTGSGGAAADRILWSGTLPPRGLVAVQMDVQLADGLPPGHRIRLSGEISDNTWGQTQPLVGEMFVAFHQFLPLMIDGRIPPIYLPVVGGVYEPPPFEPLSTPTPFPLSPLPAPTPTPTPAGR